MQMTPLQRSRTHLSAQITPKGLTHAGAIEAWVQRSRTHLSAEIRSTIPDQATDGSLKRPLQRSRTHLSAEIMPVAFQEDLDRTHCRSFFNGARTHLSAEIVSKLQDSTHPPLKFFNGAALI